MESEIESLLALQEVDKEEANLRERLERYDASRKMREAEVAKVEVKVETLREQIRDLEKRVRESERQVYEWRESLGRFEAQQSRVKTQKEYDALAHELEETRQKISDADDHGLKFLEEEEQLEAEMVKTQAKLEQNRRECEEEMARIDEREAATRAAIEICAERRQSLSASIDPARLHRYDQLKQRFVGTVVVPVVNGNCGGCFMHVTLNRVQVAGREAAGLVECNACHRFLFMPEAETE